VASPSKRKGDTAELEVQGLLRELLGVPARRALGAGRKDDVGDITGVPDTVIQVVSRKDFARGLREKLPEVEEQRRNAAAQFAAVFLRMPGGRYVVAMTPEQWAAMWREAV
jgi:Holliday junction resolvase